MTAWLLASPLYQQPCRWPHRINRSSPSTRNQFNYLCYLSGVVSSCEVLNKWAIYHYVIDCEHLRDTQTRKTCLLLVTTIGENQSIIAIYSPPPHPQPPIPPPTPPPPPPPPIIQGCHLLSLSNDIGPRKWAPWKLLTRPHSDNEKINKPQTTGTSMGILPDTYNCGLRMRRECRERLTFQCELAIPTCITVREWRTCRDACGDR